MTTSPRIGECVFCAQVGELSDEDLISKWISRLLIKRTGKRPKIAFSRRIVDGDDTGTSERQIIQSYSVLKIPSVCRRCNNGWMSKIDRAASRVVKRMMPGHRIGLTVADQETLARWLALKTLLVDLVDDASRMFEPGDYHGFYDNPEPPQGFKATIGCIDTQGKDENYFNIDKLVASEAIDDVAEGTPVGIEWRFTIGHVFFHCGMPNRRSENITFLFNVVPNPYWTRTLADSVTRGSIPAASEIHERHDPNRRDRLVRAQRLGRKPRRQDQRPRLMPAELAEIVNEVDRSASIAVDPNDVCAHLVIPDEDGHPLQQIIAAFAYTARIPTDGSRRFSGQYTLADGSEIPPPFEQLPAETIELWKNITGLVTSPVARARFHDICFEARWGNGRDHARAAIEAYLDEAGRDLAPFVGIQRIRASLDMVHSYERAIDLARRTSQADLVSKTLASIEAAADAALEDLDLGAGVVLGLLDALSDGKADSSVQDLLAERARVRYQDDVFNTVHIIGTQMKVPGIAPERRSELWRDVVGAWLMQADKTGGSVRMAHLQQAVNVARDHELADLVDTATTRMQAMNVDDLGLVRRRHKITIDREKMEEILTGFTDAPTWQQALDLIHVLGPPTGKLDLNQAQVDEAIAASPLSSTLPHVKLGGDGLPRFTASTPEEMADWNLTKQELDQLVVLAPLFDEALRRIWDKWGPLSEPDLVKFLCADHVDPLTTGAVARSFLRYFEGDTEGALYTATPRIESIVRSIVLKMELPVYRTQRAQSPGQYPGLGALLPALRNAGMDESWCRFIGSTFSTAVGANIRNELSHGFEVGTNSAHASLALIACLHLSRAVGLEPRSVSRPFNQAPPLLEHRLRIPVRRLLQRRLHRLLRDPVPSAGSSWRTRRIGRGVE